MANPQNTVTELTACTKCGAVDRWKLYHRRGTKRYFRCTCGNHRVDRVIVKLRLISKNV